jgi:thioredoxin-like negative regulator of GroEL
MKEIESIEAFEKSIDSKAPVGILFTTSNCSTCKALSLKLKDKNNFFEIDIEKLPHIVSITNIYSAPTIAVYLERKQINVFSGVFSLNEVLDYIERVKSYVCA